MKKPTKAAQWIGDIVFLVVLAAVVFVFFSHNGFVGSGVSSPIPTDAVPAVLGFPRGGSGATLPSMTSLVVAALAYLDQVLGGSLGGAIVALSLGIRFALMPLSLALARRGRRNQAIARALQPELEVIKAKYAKKPEKFIEEMGRLHRKHNYSPLDLPTMLGGLLQLPVFGLLYGAIRRALAPGRAFLWIRNLTVPKVGLTLLILMVSATTAYLMPAATEHARLMMVLVQVIVTSLFVWKLAAGLGLYWAASGLVSLVQAIWLRRPELKNARAA